ncbi:MAG: hypothetical protein HY748_15345 [Elusimicrobia bacterium]|nr:hypothetical protein [Elusimicrobiota bacterium]
MPRSRSRKTKDQGGRLDLPFAEGARLGLNAVPDLLLDGKGAGGLCGRGEGLLARHDRASTLPSRKEGKGMHRLNLELPGKGAGDWLDGYAAALKALAAQMDLGGAAPKAGNVALVGYLMDRNEGDHLGNVRELERMLAALGLKAVSVWLSGRPYESLAEARHAAAVVSLPHGREAGRVLAKRLGVKLVEAELPFGLDRTRRFMERLGKEFGKQKEAADFIKQELDEIVPRLEWSVPHAFLNRRFAFAGDPHYGPAFAELIAELGGVMAGMLLTAGPHHLAKAQREALEKSQTAWFEPEAKAVRKRWNDKFWSGVDLLVATTQLLEIVKPATGWLEMGYPSYLTHAPLEDPFLGFQGCLGFLSKAATETAKGFCLKAGAA